VEVVPIRSAPAIARLRTIWRLSSRPDEGIAPLDFGVLRTVLRYLLLLGFTRSPIPKIFPLADGGISLQWDPADCLIVVEFDADGDKTALIRRRGNRQSGTLEQLESEILKILKG
jgi:hypothetical protein